MTSIAYVDLKTLRDNGELIPGHQYRITDYVATTVQADTQSAVHAFDIIVTADSVDKLNETARAIVHDGDLPDDVVDGSIRTKYFAGCKLAAWKVQYCLDNDTARFAWADATNGKGVVYRLIDEFGNDCPYDFKGIRFKAYGDADDVWRYTFDSGDADGNADVSKDGWGRDVFENRIRVYRDSGTQKLNRIVFKGTGYHSNAFGDNCYNNTFGEYCSSNVFGNNCESNTFGGYCESNTFGDYCSSNTFGEYCGSNTFRGYCESNTFGDYCESNAFRDYCGSNTFGDDCSSNTFGGSCSSNIFGEYCSSNTFGDYCSSNTFGNNCGSNTFGNNCGSNTFGFLPDEYDPNNTYQENDVCIYEGTIYICIGTYVTGVFDPGKWRPDPSAAAKSFYQYILFESGVQYVCLDCMATRSDSECFQNVQVSMGVCGIEFGQSGYPEYKLIQDSNADQAVKTIYKPANSIEVEV